MRIALRAIGIIAALSVIATVIFLIGFIRPGLRALLATGAFGYLTIIGWIVTFVAGPIATVQLFRLRASGLRWGAVLFGYMLVYYIAGILFFRAPGVAAAPLVVLCVILAALVAVLLSPPAKNACLIARVTRKLTGAA